MIKDIAFVVTPVTDMKRARAFYEGPLGLKPNTESADVDCIEYEIGAGTFAIANADEKWQPSSLGSSVAFEVEDIHAAVEKLKESGARFDMEVTETPVCHLAVVLDPDDTKVLIHKRKVR